MPAARGESHSESSRRWRDSRRMLRLDVGRGRANGDCARGRGGPHEPRHDTMGRSVDVPAGLPKAWPFPSIARLAACLAARPPACLCLRFLVDPKERDRASEKGREH